MIEIWHMKNEIDSDDRFSVSYGAADKAELAANVRRLWDKDGYVKVATVDTDDLELAFRLTNNVDTSWSMQPHHRVTVVAPPHVINDQTLGHKSSEMGDVFVKRSDMTECFVVAMTGFQPVLQGVEIERR